MKRNEIVDRAIAVDGKVPIAGQNPLSQALYHTPLDQGGAAEGVFSTPHEIAALVRSVEGSHYRAGSTVSLAGYIQQCAHPDGRPADKPVSRRLAESIRLAVRLKLGREKAEVFLERFGSLLPTGVSSEAVAVEFLSDWKVGFQHWETLRRIDVISKNTTAILGSGIVTDLLDGLLWAKYATPLVRIVLPEADACADLWEKLFSFVGTHIKDRCPVAVRISNEGVRTFLSDQDQEDLFKVHYHSSAKELVVPQVVFTSSDGRRQWASVGSTEATRLVEMPVLSMENAVEFPWRTGA